MRWVVTVAVLLAVVATALVAVCQHSETRRMQRRVWQLERRRVRLEREAERMAAAIEATRTPRRLLVEHDLHPSELFGADVPELLPEDLPEEEMPIFPPARAAPVPAGREAAVPPGFVTGGNFEGGGR